MEIILLKDFEKLGTRGQVVKVADGFGRNYLLPKKLALAATPANRKAVEQLRTRFLKEEAKEKADAEDLAKILQDASVSFTRKAGEQQTLFGSVTALDIAEALAAQGFKIDRRKIHLDAPLKVLGEYDVAVKLHPGVTSTVKVKIAAEGEPAAAAPAPEEAKPSEPSAT
jgi:large subunit ribosomal protein L9